MSSHDLCNVEVQDEGKAEAEAYKEFACFCKDTQVISTGCIASRIVLTVLVRGEVWTFSEDQSSSVEPPNELVVESCPMSSMQSWILLTCVLCSLKTFKLLIFFLRCDLDVVSEIHRNTVRRLHSC